MEASWKAWIAENIERGSNLFELRDILVKNNYSLATIRREMGDKFPMDPMDSAAKRHYFMPPDMYQALTQIRITKPAMPGARPIEQVKTDPSLQLYVIEQFLSEQECVALCALARSKLSRSVVAGGAEVQYVRTSSTCILNKTDDPLVRNIDQRIAAAMGIHLSYSQAIEAQLYLPGQEFKPHMDTFPPFTSLYENYTHDLGNRTWTFMIYLQPATKGGGTEFTKIGRTFNPAPGTAIIWNNLDEAGIPIDETEHAGQPVIEGEKIVITKWFRERGKGLMFMDPLLG